MLRIAVFILSIIGIFFVVVSLVFPEYKKMNELTTTLQEEKEKLETVQKRVSNFENIASVLAQGSNSEKISYINTRLPKNPDEDSVLNVLGQVGGSSGIFIGGFEVDGTNQDNRTQSTRSTQNNITEEGNFANALRMKSIPLTLGGVGSYENTKQFFGFLQNIERKFDISEVTVALGEEDAQAEEGVPSGEGTLSMDMDVKFEYALAPLLPEKTAILQSFEERASSQITDFQVQSSVFPEGGLNDLEYTSGGRENPYLPAS